MKKSVNKEKTTQGRALLVKTCTLACTKAYEEQPDKDAA
jgi:hypothetical protein